MSKTPKPKRPTLKEAAELRWRLDRAEKKAVKFDALVDALVAVLEKDIRDIAEDSANAAVDDLQVSR